MEFSATVDLPAPARFSIAGGFAIAVVLASMLHTPDVIDHTGPFSVFSVDKWIHFGSYATIAFLLAYATRSNSKATILSIAVVTILLGVSVEFIQGTIAWRTREAADVVANTAGVLLAVVVWQVVWWTLPVGQDSLQGG